MAKPEWGEKRVCQSCKGLFYDMQRVQIQCPKCGEEFNLDTGKKTRRSKVARSKDSSKSQTEQPSVSESYDEELLNAENLEDLDEIELDERFIEDDSELGEQEDEVEDIIDIPKRASD